MTGANGGGGVADRSMTVEAPVDRTALTDDESRTLGRLLAKAQAGDTKALDELRPILDKTGLWDFCGDLSRRVQESWLEAMTGRNKLIRAAYERKANDLRRELLASGDGPLERLLVDRVVVTWLQVCHADTACAGMLKTDDGYSFREAAFQHDRQDRANARHLKAVKALATVRRLLVPAVQVNIAKQQIISQGGPAVPASETDGWPARPSTSRSWWREPCRAGARSARREPTVQQITYRKPVQERFAHKAATKWG